MRTGVEHLLVGWVTNDIMLDSLAINLECPRCLTLHFDYPVGENFEHREWS